MKNQKLIPLEDWVLKRQSRIELWDTDTMKIFETNKFVNEVFKYAKLLKSTPKLGDFIPCDEDGVPLEKVVFFPANMDGTKLSEEHKKAYQEAERRVLWEGEWNIANSELGTFLGLREKNKKTQNITFDNPKQTYSDLTNKGLIFKREL